MKILDLEDEFDIQMKAGDLLDEVYSTVKYRIDNQKEWFKQFFEDISAEEILEHDENFWVEVVMYEWNCPPPRTACDYESLYCIVR